jgi:RNA polymerase sigma-70 factor, ECF subfamily
VLYPPNSCPVESSTSAPHDGRARPIFPLASGSLSRNESLRAARSGRRRNLRDSGRIPKAISCVEINMDHTRDMEAQGPFDARYLAFLETITQLRPRLHRYCSRMTGSVMDGEDVVQEGLFEAYRKLDQYDESRPLAPWLFKIAHNRCIDFLRRRGVRVEAETAAMTPDFVMPATPPVLDIGRAVEQLVISLPPKERACVLLKDVFDYTLEEIAELVGSTVGGVKAALNRGRSKLAALPEPVKSRREPNPELSRLLHLYVDRFNKRDWDGLRELISADAQLRVVDRFAGLFEKAPYFKNYERQAVPWRLAVAEVDSELAVVALHEHRDEWRPASVARLEVIDQHIVRIVDYAHCAWVLPAATSVVIGPPS